MSEKSTKNIKELFQPLLLIAFILIACGLLVYFKDTGSFKYDPASEETIIQAAKDNPCVKNLLEKTLSELNPYSDLYLSDTDVINAVRRCDSYAKASKNASELRENQLKALKSISYPSLKDS